MIAKTPKGSGRVEHQLRAIQSEFAPAFRKMPVIADINADLSDCSFKHWEAEIAIGEIILFVEFTYLGNVNFTKLSTIAPIGIDHRSSVVKLSVIAKLIDWGDNDHIESFGCLHHQLCGRPFGNGFGRTEPAVVDFRWKVGHGPNFLQAHNMHALAGGIFNQRHMTFGHLIAYSVL